MMPSPMQSLPGVPQPVELSQEDLDTLKAPRTYGGLTAEHRELTRHMAQGYAGVHIAQAVGLVPLTVSQLTAAAIHLK